MTSDSGGLPASESQRSTLQAGDAAAAEKHSYREILRSSALIGGSSMVTIAIRIARTKAMALMLGPAGFGLMSLYTSIADVTRSVADMGVGSSGVRQIAEAVGSSRPDRIARTATVLRRLSVVLGVVGAALVVVFSAPLSTLTFGNREHARYISLLSLAVLFGCIAGGQSALIQGVRRIADLAKLEIFAALVGSVLSVALVYLYAEWGIVLSIVCIAGTRVFASWWYSRKIQTERVSMTRSAVAQEAGDLLKLGVAFMVTGLMMTGAAYAVRLVLLRELGLEAAGLYQAAWTLGGLYVGFVLGAMNRDFYPRLTGVAWDKVASNRLVNEQAQVSLLLAGPGILATFTFAPLVISLFYTASFEPAAGILRWICLGATLQVINVPVGYVILARNERSLFFWTELGWCAIHVGIAWLLVADFGADGAGMAFFGAYLCHGFAIYAIVRHINGFRWSAENLRGILLLVGLVGVSFVSFLALSPLVAFLVGAVATLTSVAVSVRRLSTLLPPEMRERLRRFIPGRSR